MKLEEQNGRISMFRLLNIEWDDMFFLGKRKEIEFTKM